jgi:hypothetical protein
MWFSILLVRSSSRKLANTRLWTIRPAKTYYFNVYMYIYVTWFILLTKGRILMAVRPWSFQSQCWSSVFALSPENHTIAYRWSHTGYAQSTWHASTWNFWTSNEPYALACTGLPHLLSIQWPQENHRSTATLQAWPRHVGISLLLPVPKA